MRGRIEYIDKSLINSEVKGINGSLLEIKIPERKADIFANDYEKKGFKRGIDGFFKRVSLDELLGENIKNEDKIVDFVVDDDDTLVADLGGVDKKQVVFIKKYEKRQKDRTPKVGK